MDIVKAYSGRSFFRIVFFMGLLCILVNSGFYIALDLAGVSVPSPLQNGFDSPLTYFIPVASSVFGLFGFFIWLFLRGSVSGLAKKAALEAKKTAKQQAKPKDGVDKREKIRNDKRLFLHLLSVLQREGRLVDFFSENLEEYDDDQIGGAVRSIHESCKKIMDKYLKYKPVINEGEDEEITVQPGFDPASLKLTGNVTGEPPFKGVVRHRGWKAARVDLPTLSGSRDPELIAPAEIEII